MIDGKRIDAGLDIGEVFHKQLGHIRIKTSAVRHRCSSMRTRPIFLPISSPRCLCELPQSEAVPNIPRNARQLAGAIGHARGEARERITHVFLPEPEIILIHIVNSDAAYNA
jgi:hypothetical protein